MFLNDLVRYIFLYRSRYINTKCLDKRTCWKVEIEFTMLKIFQLNCLVSVVNLPLLVGLTFTEINFSNFTFNTFSRTIFLQPLQKDVARVSSAAAPEAWPDPPSPVHVASIAPVSKELLYWAWFFGEQPDSGNEHTPPRTAGALLR